MSSITLEYTTNYESATEWNKDIIFASSTGQYSTNSNTSPTENYIGNGEEHHLSSEYIAFMVVSSVGVLDNAFVVFVILSYIPMRKRLTNIYIVNQSILDMTASIIFLLGIDDRVYNRIFNGVFGNFYCIVWKSGALLWGCFIGSTFNLTTITLDRFFELVHPLWHKHVMTRKKVYIIILSIWLAGLCYGFLYNGTTSRMVNGKCLIIAIWPSHGSITVAAIFDFLIPFILPVIIMVYCYSKMALTLKSRVVPSDTEHMSQSERRRKEKMVRVRSNILKTLAVVCFSFVLCWAGNQVWFFLFGLGYSLDFSSPFYTLSVFAVCVNCAINPFIYMMKYQHFQQAVKKVVFKINMSHNHADPSALYTRPMQSTRQRQANENSEV